MDKHLFPKFRGWMFFFEKYLKFHHPVGISKSQEEFSDTLAPFIFCDLIYPSSHLSVIGYDDNNSILWGTRIKSILIPCIVASNWQIIKGWQQYVYDEIKFDHLHSIMPLILPQALNLAIFNVMPTSYWTGHLSWIPGSFGSTSTKKRILPPNPQLHCCATGHSTVDWLSKWKKTSIKQSCLDYL